MADEQPHALAVLDQLEAKLTPIVANIVRTTEPATLARSAVVAMWLQILALRVARSQRLG